MGWTSFDNYMNSRTVLERRLTAVATKTGTTAEAAGVPHSLWRVGPVPAAGADPASSGGGTVYSNTDGSLAKWAAVEGSGFTKQLVSWSARMSTAGSLVLCDRLVGFSGISLSSVATTVINMTAPTRYTDGLGVEAWFEITTATTTTAAQIRLQSYTNQDGTSGRQGALLTLPATATNVDAFIGPLPLQAGDTGIKSIESVNVGVAASAGVANVVLIAPIAEMGLVANLTNIYDGMTALDRIYDGATLMFYYQPTATTINTIRSLIKAGY